MNGVILVGSDIMAQILSLVLAHRHIPVTLLHSHYSASEGVPLSCLKELEKLWPWICQINTNTSQRAGASQDEGKVYLHGIRSAIQADPLVDSRQYESILSFFDHNRGVDLRYLSGTQCHHLRGQWLLAMDGASSEIRRLLQVDTFQPAIAFLPEAYTSQYFAFGHILLAGQAAHQFYHPIDWQLWLDDIVALEEHLCQAFHAERSSSVNYERSRRESQERLSRLISYGSQTKSTHHL